MARGIISMAQGEGQISSEGSDRFVTSDVCGDIFGRVDGTTLARLSSVSTQFRCAALDEGHWENLCNKRWPSTTQPAVRTLISSAGGFRKFYCNCFPFATPRHGQLKCREELSASAADFVSLVDVSCSGKIVLSRVVDGINGAEALCGPLVDIVETTWEGDYGVPMNPEEDGPLVSVETIAVRGTPESSYRHRLWRTLRNQMRVSWILIHKTTHQMVNLASWQPLSGMRYRGYGGEDDIFLFFGTILPNPDSTSVLCNILMRCSTCECDGEELHSETPAMTVVKVTELGFTLEAADGVHYLRRQEAVNVLSHAMTCDKTIDHSTVASIYHKFVATQTANREALIRRENQRQTATAICFVSTIVYIVIWYCFKPSC